MAACLFGWYSKLRQGTDQLLLGPLEVAGLLLRD